MARKREFFEPFMAALVGLILLGGTFAYCHETGGGGKFLVNEWFVVLLWLAPVLLMARLLPQGRQAEKLAQSTAVVSPGAFVLLGVLIAYLFSGAARFPTFYFMNWSTRAGPAQPGPNCALDVLILGTALLIPLAVLWKRGLAWLLPAILIGLQCLCAAKLAACTGGHAIYQDDHPSFMFRTWQFSEVFPRILTYNPYWNAGAIDSVLSDTGSVAYGLLIWPLLVFFRPDTVHTLAVGLVFIFTVPWMMVVSARLMGMNRQAMWCAGILGTGVSYTFFLWMLHFGTVGASVSTAFLIPVAACVYRVIWLDRRGWKLGALLCFCAYILVQWPPGMLMAATLVISLLFSCRQWTVKKLSFLFACTAIVMVLDMRSLVLLLTESEDLMGFVMKTNGAAAASAESGIHGAVPTLSAGWNILMEGLLHGHPGILFMGLAGVFFLPEKRLRIWLAPPIVTLALLGGWGGQLFPNLQISRMVIPLFFVGAMSASVHMATFINGEKRSERVLSAFLVALLVLGGWNTARTYGNGGYAPFASLGTDVEHLAEEISAHAPEGTRVLFAGRTVHGFGRGHIAYLPRLTNREMMACDYYAFPPSMVEYEYPPRPFRASEDGTARFLEIHGVSLILSYHEKWRDYFASQPERYAPLPGIDVTGVHIHAFAVRGEASIFRQNSGHVQSAFNQLSVSLDDPNTDAVIAYTWDRRLRPSGRAELFDYDAGDDIHLLGIRPNGETQIEIRFRSWL